MQVYGVDYFETSAPVARLVSIWSILAIMSCNNWDIGMFNFHSAYLNGEFDKDIFMEQPPHHETVDQKCYIIKLHKTLYGHKQVGMTHFVIHLLISALIRLRPILLYSVCMQAATLLSLRMTLP
jgi:hypothetical protein